jgi:hypothetical protein
VAAALAGLLAAGPAAARPCPPVRVLFVCPAGTVKSAIAREVLRRRAAEAKVAVAVTSRGVHPEDHVSPALAARLAADGIDPRREPAQALSAGDAAAADIVIAFDEAAEVPGLAGARVWATPSWNDDYPHAKAALSAQVDGLVAELANRGCGGQRVARP